MGQYFRPPLLKKGDIQDRTLGIAAVKIETKARTLVSLLIVSKILFLNQTCHSSSQECRTLLPCPRSDCCSSWPGASTRSENNSLRAGWQKRSEARFAPSRNPGVHQQAHPASDNFRLCRFKACVSDICNYRVLVHNSDSIAKYPNPKSSLN